MRNICIQSRPRFGGDAGRFTWIKVEGLSLSGLQNACREAMRFAWYDYTPGDHGDPPWYDWEVVDVEGLGPMLEYTSLPAIAKRDAAIGESGAPAAFFAFIAHEGGDFAEVSDFKDRYFGEFDSTKAFGAAVAEADGVYDSLPEQFWFYFDCELYGRCCLMDNYFESDGYYFRRSGC